MLKKAPAARSVRLSPGAAGVRTGQQLQRARGGSGVGRERGRGGRSSPRRLKATALAQHRGSLLLLRTSIPAAHLEEAYLGTCHGWIEAYPTPVRQRTSWPPYLRTHHSPFGAASNPPVGQRARLYIQHPAHADSVTPALNDLEDDEIPPQKLLPGDQVLLRSRSPGPLQTRWTGPHTIILTTPIAAKFLGHQPRATQRRHGTYSRLPHRPTDSSHQLSCCHPAEPMGPGPPHHRERGNMPPPEQGVLLFCQPVRHSPLQSQGAQRWDLSKVSRRLYLALKPSSLGDLGSPLGRAPLYTPPVNRSLPYTLCTRAPGTNDQNIS
ncbi:uncharacterized protein [Canis lupus baileyi]|uniref:uncharacterized protein n=1 Tax=Canis lupus baileyi TaxID=143281 RepID=UPI003B96A4C2